MEKFEIDLKWGSYLFLTNTITTIFISLLLFLIDGYNLRYLSNILLIVFIIQLLYFTIKVLKENKKYGLNKGFRKILVFIRFLVFYFMLASCLNGISLVYFKYFPSLFPYRDKDISEFLIDENSNEDYVVTLNDFLYILKRKLRLAY